MTITVTGHYNRQETATLRPRRHTTASGAPYYTISRRQLAAARAKCLLAGIDELDLPQGWDIHPDGHAVYYP